MTVYQCLNVSDEWYMLQCTEDGKGLISIEYTENCEEVLNVSIARTGCDFKDRYIEIMHCDYWDGAEVVDVTTSTTTMPPIFSTETIKSMDTTVGPESKDGPLTATLTTHSDNIGVHYISNDGGASSSWTEIGTESYWPTAFSYHLTDVSADTKIRVSVTDEGVVGGFIATVSFDGKQYSTTNPLRDGHWRLVSASDGDTSSLVYHEKTSSPWSISTADIANDAVWVWNEGIYNTMVFEFDFASVVHIVSDFDGPTGNGQEEEEPHREDGPCDGHGHDHHGHHGYHGDHHHHGEGEYEEDGFMNLELLHPGAIFTIAMGCCLWCLAVLCCTKRRRRRQRRGIEVATSEIVGAETQREGDETYVVQAQADPTIVVTDDAATILLTEGQPDTIR